jgi:hypothetical protein
MIAAHEVKRTWQLPATRTLTPSPDATILGAIDRLGGDTAMRSLPFFGLLGVLLVPMQRAQAEDAPAYDWIIRGGIVYDGSGKAGVRNDIGIRGDKIAAIGDLAKAKAKTTIDASGLALTPGELAGEDHLQGDRTVKRYLPRLVDNAHAATA